ncbi:hypothetical protein NECAME_16234 [Necator americanus]|uniref:Uncharacterized protein n=1 Tax=Necator americanus TaxID=51031 RepID=W2TXN8_NECAM|nr:hypothetical protein NECAME_16234 [Necator americanus]ETN86633.1 hypothetical protein NECAME_16234 [Necator americanus]
MAQCHTAKNKGHPPPTSCQPARRRREAPESDARGRNSDSVKPVYQHAQDDTGACVKRAECQPLQHADFRIRQ